MPKSPIVKLSNTPRLKAKSAVPKLAGTQTPQDRFSFIHSSFSTPYLKGGKKPLPKRKRDDHSSEEEAILKSESEPGVDMSISQDATSSTKVRSSLKVRIVRPKYDLRDLQSSSDETSEASFDEGDGPVKEQEEEEVKLANQSRARRTERQDEEMEEA